MTRYLLDTNTVSHVLKSHPRVTEHLVAVPMAALCISAITEGELLFGLAKRPAAKRLHLVVREFLYRVEALPWDGAAAERYGPLRARLALSGKAPGPLDLLIIAHAASLGAVLVTNDQAMRQAAGILTEDWTA